MLAQKIKENWGRIVRVVMDQFGGNPRDISLKDMKTEMSRNERVEKTGQSLN